VSGQRLEAGQALSFHPASMEAVGTSLMVLNANGSNVRDARPLIELLALRTLNLVGPLSSFRESIDTL